MGTEARRSAAQTRAAPHPRRPRAVCPGRPPRRADGSALCAASSPLTTARKDRPRGQGVGAHRSLPHTRRASALGSATPPGVRLESGSRQPPGCRALPGSHGVSTEPALGPGLPAPTPGSVHTADGWAGRLHACLGTATSAGDPRGQTSGGHNNPCPRDPVQPPQLCVCPPAQHPLTPADPCALVMRLGALDPPPPPPQHPPLLLALDKPLGPGWYRGGSGCHLMALRPPSPAMVTTQSDPVSPGQDAQLGALGPRRLCPPGRPFAPHSGSRLRGRDLTASFHLYTSVQHPAGRTVHLFFR